MKNIQFLLEMVLPKILLLVLTFHMNPYLLKSSPPKPSSSTPKAALPVISTLGALLPPNASKAFVDDTPEIKINQHAINTFISVIPF